VTFSVTLDGATCEWLAKATDDVGCWLPTYSGMYGE
jgi:hypothetical protein